MSMCDRETDKEKKKERERQTDKHRYGWYVVCVYVCGWANRNTHNTIKHACFYV